MIRNPKGVTPPKDGGISYGKSRLGPLPPRPPSFSRVVAGGIADEPTDGTATEIADSSFTTKDSSLRYASMIEGQRFHHIGEFELESGCSLRDFSVAYKTWGCLDPTSRDNAIVICPCLDWKCRCRRLVSDGSSAFYLTRFSILIGGGPLFGPGNVFDPSVFFIVCFNLLGSPYGSHSPLQHRARYPNSSKLFPTVTIRDNVRLNHKVLTEIMNVSQVQCVVGGSMGGMQVLEWARMFGQWFARTIVPIATSSRQSAWALAFNQIQRQTIMSDTDFMGGRYTISKPPSKGLGLARIQAMMTYRSHYSFEQRFGPVHLNQLLRKNGIAGNGETTITDCRNGDCDPLFEFKYEYAAHNYLQYQARKFTERFDANCYLSLLDTMDTHDIFRTNEGASDIATDDAKVDVDIRQPALIICMPFLSVTKPLFDSLLIRCSSRNLTHCFLQ